MDACSDRSISRVIFIKSSQVGATEILLNVLGFFIDQDPAPVLLIQPTLDMGKAFSKDRLAPMLRDTPALKGKVKDARSRDSDNTVLHKVFPGGHVTIAGANSAASLASRPIRVFLGDEVDRYPPSAGTEGDPVSLARKRTSNFWNRREVLASTPTVKNFSRIEDEWELSDKRRFFVPCPHCGAEDHLRWEDVHWPEGRPDLAAIHCHSCGAEWNEAERLRSIRKGRWVATAESQARVAGFHLNELYSPWSTPAKMAVDFASAKGDPEKLKTFVNTSLGEVWEEQADHADGGGIMSRLEDLGEPDPHCGHRAPPQVQVVTVGVDVQDDRVELERVGWGQGEESWSLDTRVIYGDPSGREIWDELQAYVGLHTRRGDTDLAVRSVAIDSGGHYTQMVYAFARRFATARRVHAIKGIAGAGRPVWPKRGKRTAKSRDVNVYMVGVDSAKDVIYARLRRKEPGPGFAHFPTGRERSYFDQLTSEVVKRKRTRGYPVRYYELPPGKRNEALDCRVYAYAALLSLNVRWSALPGAAGPPAAREAAPAAPSPQRPNPIGETAARLAQVLSPQPAPAPRPQSQRPARTGWAAPKRSGWLKRDR